MRTDSLISKVKPQHFHSPGLLPSPIAPHTSARQEATHSSLETNLSCPFQGVPLEINFLLCSVTAELGCTGVTGGLGRQDLQGAE